MINKPPHIMLVHNHTEGISELSEVDKATTERRIKAGKLLSIKVSDHPIIS
uniref:RadC-like JAB domain-containing protein n=1 Tax=Candidatus Kentrum sp. FW TaxID=2126338 RepID=A0A450TXM8_9GAMM|nr:MAG: RadC-like JAB domain-containing protein [Candidatus Kentron sp. FW]